MALFGILMARVFHRRRKRPGTIVHEAKVVPSAVGPVLVPRRVEKGPSVRAFVPGGMEGGALEVTPQGASVACPSCRREFPEGIRFCLHDARRLVPAADIVERARASGSICPVCRRSFDAGVRYCPHDADELIPVALWEAMRGPRAQTALAGVLGKICPHCSSRYDLASTFCGKDGSELVTIN